MRTRTLKLILFLIGTVSIAAQITVPERFPLQSYEKDYNESFILGLQNNDLILFWYDSFNLEIKYARSTDNGNSWIDENILVVFSSQLQISPDINAIQLNSGRILFTYRSGEYRIIYSDDNCNSWTQPSILPTRPTPPLRRAVYWSSLGKSSNNSAVFVHSYRNPTGSFIGRGIYTIASTDGVNWSGSTTIDTAGVNGNLLALSSSKDMIVYNDSTNGSSDIFYRTTTDGGFSWSSKELLIGSDNDMINARGIKDQSGKVWIFFEEEEQTSLSGFTQKDINYITSTNDGNNWSPKEKFTTYKGIDDNLSLSLWSGKPVVSFSSSRSFGFQNQKKQIYYGIGGETIDTNGPPYLFAHSVIPASPNHNESVTFRAWVLDDTAVDSVILILQNNGSPPQYYQMYDDGMHGDSLANDNIYGFFLQSGFNDGDAINYSFLLKDVSGNQSGFNAGFFTVPGLSGLDKYLLETNNLMLPVNNRGVLADVNIDGQSGLQFGESIILFSGGFFISGKNGSTEWAAGQATSPLVENFYPGPVNSSPGDIRNSLFIIKESDPDFGLSWQQYRFAVLNGADFYDGNNDGIYDPVDLNGNGVWDENEDRPDMFGDETIWCVYNDGVPGYQRLRYAGIDPQGIDIQQTNFAINESLNPVHNMLFVRYRIINTGTVAENFEDVYFTVWSDPDIGDYTNDLVGSDTLLSLGYCYNDSLDNLYGSNPPAIGTAVLQGPAVYIPGETFIDNNGNGIYEPGIDTPLDTAIVNNGLIGTNSFPGAKNLGMTSFIYTQCGNPILNEPNNVQQARYFMTGKNLLGQYTDPCTWLGGVVYGVPCADVNPIYHYSGDPVNSFGWINNYPCDQRMWTNVGPFTLPQNEKVDIWTAYIVGRGNDNLNSVTKLKEYTLAANNFYASNFTQLPTGVKDEKITLRNYELYQNYPNPFNPTTTLRYSIPKDGVVTLKIYNILGQKVAVLVNEYQKANDYQIQFDSKGLASGVYIYRLQVNDFSQSKKMILLK
jgi:hypothetical protein